MSRSTDKRPPETSSSEDAEENATGKNVLALNAPPPDPTTVEIVEENLEPRDKKTLEILERVFIKRDENTQDEQQRRLADEANLIREAATRVTGLSLLSDDKDKRLLISHHLQEFLAALPLPSGLSCSEKDALRREALTMLLKFGPQDDIERMMATQLIASHMAGMWCFGRAAENGASSQVVTQSLNQAQKMSRLFLDIERTFRQRRKQLGRQDDAKQNYDHEKLAKRLLMLLETVGPTFEDDDPSA